MAASRASGWEGRPRQHFSASVAVTLVAVLYLMSREALATTTVTTDLWLSGSASQWTTATSSSSAKTTLMNAAQTDFNTLVQAEDGGASVTVSDLSSYSAPASGPAYGAKISFSVSTTTLTEAQILAAVRAGTLPTLSSSVNSVPGINMVVKALPSSDPTTMTSMGNNLLPITGSTFVWQLIISEVISASAVIQAGFSNSFQNDLQATVDPNFLQHLIIYTPSSSSFANATSCYMSYAVWAFPGAPATADALAIVNHDAMASTLTQFNSLLSTVSSTFTALADYAQFIPSSVSPHTPLPGDPFTSSSSSGSGMILLRQESGRFLLLFSGTATKWQQLWNSNRAGVESAVNAAVTKALHRRNFENSGSVLSATTVAPAEGAVGGLQVVCDVVQGITDLSAHPWSSAEISSILMQGDYSAVKAVYSTASSIRADPAERRMAPALIVTLATIPDGSLVSVGIDYDDSFEMTNQEVGMIVMGSCLGGLMIIVLVVTVLCCCCCPGCVRDRKGKRTASDTDDFHDHPFDTKEAASPCSNPIRPPFLDGYNARTDKPGGFSRNTKGSSTPPTTYGVPVPGTCQAAHQTSPPPAGCTIPHYNVGGPLTDDKDTSGRSNGIARPSPPPSPRPQYAPPWRALSPSPRGAAATIHNDEQVRLSQSNSPTSFNTKLSLPNPLAIPPLTSDTFLSQPTVLEHPLGVPVVNGVPGYPSSDLYHGITGMAKYD